MKFHFKTQQFQTDAVNAVCDVFKGQLPSDPESYRYTIDPGIKKVEHNLQLQIKDTPNDDSDTGMGYKNADVQLTETQLLKNLHSIQSVNNIPLSSSLDKSLGAISLDVEMETGTGKTYVYIKTMLQLNKLYGWSKFIIVVPSVAIREGVKKTLETTQEHFMREYKQKVRYFIYDSSNLQELEGFSSSSDVNVMIINTQAFAATFSEDDSGKKSKAKLIIHSKRDEFGSRRPIDVIKANRPILILDEPQKMGGKVTQSALKKDFKPLFSINYSATHKVKHNTVYVLDTLHAYQQKLVKKIEVKGFELNRLSGTDGYVYFSEIVLSKGEPKARLEIDCKKSDGTSGRKMVSMVQGDRLSVKSGGLEVYRDLYIAEINAHNGTITFSNGETLGKQEASGDFYEQDIRRVQIRETIQSHLQKEQELFNNEIKCLSLFFIDEVAKYRQYDDDGEEILGEYGKIFEEEYEAVVAERLTLGSDSYEEYLRNISAGETHKGYFSVDKKGRAVNSTEKRGAEGSDDVSAYELILKQKERLLSFSEPTRFIFSHSALREGWDNPNVFQICTLKQSDSSMTKRQEVGRGLRLCVNQSGERQDVEALNETLVHSVNKLTIIASESYLSFAGDLQKQLKEALHARPIVVDDNYFVGKVIIINENQEKHVITDKEARAAYRYLLKNDYIDDDGKINDEYRNDVANDTLAPVPEILGPLADGVHLLVRAVFDEKALEELIQPTNNATVTNAFRDDKWEEFKDLWERINKRWAYLVDFDSDVLIDKAAAALNNTLSVAQVSYTKVQGESGATLDFQVTQSSTENLKRSASVNVKYDLPQKIAIGTKLSRRTIVAVLKKLNTDKIELFVKNPEEFIGKVTKIINESKAAVVVPCVTYVPSVEEPYKREIFNMSKNSTDFSKAFAAKKSIQDYIFTDGTAAESIERKFAQDLDVDDKVLVYAKLPSGRKGFQIPTPVGNYSPDWAILFKENSGVRYVYFIAETKGTMDTAQFRPIEKAKIDCAIKLFNEINTDGVKYHYVDNYERLINDIMAKSPEDLANARL